MQNKNFYILIKRSQSRVGYDYVIKPNKTSALCMWNIFSKIYSFFSIQKIHICLMYSYAIPTLRSRANLYLLLLPFSVLREGATFILQTSGNSFCDLCIAIHQFLMNHDVIAKLFRIWLAESETVEAVIVVGCFLRCESLALVCILVEFFH